MLAQVGPPLTVRIDPNRRAVLALTACLRLHMAAIFAMTHGMRAALAGLGAVRQALWAADQALAAAVLVLPEQCGATCPQRHG